MAIAEDLRFDNTGDNLSDKETQHILDDAGLGATPETLHSIVESGADQGQDFAEKLLKAQNLSGEAYRRHFDALVDQVAQEEEISV